MMHATAAIAWAWFGYTNFALDYDKLVFTPWANGGNEGMKMSATAVDSLDTLILANLSYTKALSVVDHIYVDPAERTNFFEATIRILGGLLSAHELTQKKIFSLTAERVGSELVKAFHGLPCATLQHGKCIPSSTVSIAVAGSNVLEFSQLSRISHDPQYAIQAQTAFHTLVDAAIANDYVLPAHIKMDGSPAGGKFSYGGESDSFWEYVLKFWIFDGCKQPKFRDLFDNAVKKFHARNVKPEGHLDCFYPGLLALSYLYDGPDAHLDEAFTLIKPCLTLYDTPTHLGKDSMRGSTYTRLRPEVMESLYYLYFVTNDPWYRKQAEKIMDAIGRNARQPQGGYCGVNLNTGKCPNWPGGEYQDQGSMPSYFIAETLKYSLLFDHGQHSPLTHVFTTEAHLMPIDWTTSLCNPRSLDHLG